MKKTILSLFVLLCFITANAQFKQIAEGPVFKEPEDGAAKIVLMKNGSTMFIHFTLKKEIEVRLYDASHVEVQVTTVELNIPKELEEAAIEGIFEINGDVVILIKEIYYRIPTLYRLVIDGKTCGLKEENIIAELNKMGFGAGFAMTWGNVPEPGFYVRKDPNSDTYAIAMFNSFESDRSKRIEIVVYGADNKEIRRAYYASPQEKYKYLVYVDMAVISPDKVSVLAYGFNTANSGGKESELILANLDKGATSVSFTELNFSKDLVVTHGVVRYDPVMKYLVLIANTKTKSNEKRFTPYLALVDPFEQKLLRADPIPLSEKVTGNNKKEFPGSPQDLFINADGGFTVVCEEVKISTYTSQYGTTSANTELGRVVVVNYNRTAEPENEYLARKSQKLFDTYLSPFYLSRREGTAQWLNDGNQYKSFAYLNAKNQNYLLFNDTELNNDKQEDGDLETVRSVSGSDAFFYTLSGSDLVPKRDYMFGIPKNKREHNLALFSISDYSSKDNIYAVLKLEKGKGKNVKVVWLQP